MAEEQKVILTICNIRGLHARAASKFVKIAGEFDAQLTVQKVGDAEAEPANGTSILGLMSLAAEPGSSIEITATGTAAAAALQAITELVNNKFGEEE